MEPGANMKAAVYSWRVLPKTSPSGRAVRSRRFAPGFTLVELMVSVGILLIMLTMVGTIFSMASKASGQATAHNEIMGNFRALKSQLESDLRGLHKDSIVAFWHQITPITDPATGETKNVRTDRMVFFAMGDFQTIEQLWDYRQHRPADLAANQTDGVRTIRASAARIFYGQELNSYNQSPASNVILARRSKLLVPVVDQLAEGRDMPPGFDSASDYDAFEYESMSLAGWHYFRGDNPDQRYHNFQKEFLNHGGFLDDSDKEYTTWNRRPLISNDPQSPDGRVGLHMQLVRGCVEFKVQVWREYDRCVNQDLTHRQKCDGWQPLPMDSAEGHIPGSGRRNEAGWWPEDDVDGDGISLVSTETAQSDFASWQNPANGPRSSSIKAYYNGVQPASPPLPPAWDGLPPVAFPRAIKVTVRLVDGNLRIKDGEVFTMVFPLR